MSDIQFEIGGNPAPFKSAMQQVTESAKESFAKVTESAGIEGVKSERALHGKLAGAFSAVTKSGTLSAESIGEAFGQMAEGLKLSMGAMMTLVVAQAAFQMFMKAAEQASKMKDAVKDALSINTDVTNQSVEKVQENIKKLKEDADATNVSTMSSLQAGLEAVVQAVEEGKSISEVAKENAENYLKISQEAHTMEDQAAAKSVDEENKYLQMKLDGHEKEIDFVKEQDKLQQEINDAQNKQDAAHVASLQQQKDLTDAIHEKQINDDAEKREAKLDELRNQVHDEQLSRGGDAGKLQAAHNQEEVAKAAFGDANTRGTDPVDIEQKRLAWEQAITKEKELQKSIEDKAKDTQKEITAEQQKRKEIGETDKQKLDDATAQRKKDADALAAAQGKVGKQDLLNLQLALEKSITAEKEAQNKVDEQAKKFAEDKTKFLQDQKEAQQAVAAAQLDASMFHGETSSLAKLGLGGRVSGANYGNASQLKAAQDAAKHLAEINAAFKKLSGSIGVSG